MTCQAVKDEQSRWKGKNKIQKDIYVVYIETRIFVYNKAMSSDAASEETACSMKHR